ncbi:hemin importer ATP-binding subunit [Yersinia frederiksenii]|nr:hemin importer ATP-binding subunit [Yersinia frederiksenii]CNI03213.1 hemin importer ATP-binding subunit [Yersinia frederiksenii]
MKTAQEDIVKWLSLQPNWIKHAAHLILEDESITQEQILDLTEMLKKGTTEKTLKKYTLDSISVNSYIDDIIRIESISEVNNINALSPREPISIGGSDLTVIYGSNGSGKTGYTRILKKSCGKNTKDIIHKNIFKKNSDEEQNCTIEYRFNGDSRRVKWVVGELVDELKGIDIFDSESISVYLDKESDCSYIPMVVGLFERLVEVSNKVKGVLELEKSNLSTKLPVIPEKLSKTKKIVQLRTLTYLKNKNWISENFLWTESDEVEKKKLLERAKQVDPEEELRKTRRVKLELDKISKDFNSAISKLDSNSCKKITELYDAAITNRRIAVHSAETISNDQKLGGIGTETWTAMWKAAEQYSTTVAYRDEVFPVTKDGARCVLCHQTLDNFAQKRLSNFHEYINGKLEEIASTSENNYKKQIEDLPKKPTEEMISTVLQASNIDDVIFIKNYNAAWDILDSKASSLKDYEGNSILPVDKEQIEIKLVLDYISGEQKSIDDKIISLLEDCKTFDKAKVIDDLLELDAKLFCSENIKRIVEEYDRLVQINDLEKLITKTSSRSISIKAGDVSQKVITDRYIERFNKELKELGASHVHVELIKSRVQGGKVKHKIQVKGGAAINNILSEGECRIVTLAAFLADVTEGKGSVPFIFDDPISSLDQSFEEKTIKRLVELSRSRQVIIFTHRLSLLGLINDVADPNVIYIKRESWGTGQPASIPLFVKKPINALRDILNGRLKTASKLYETEGIDSYYPYAKSICSDVRIITERIIELTLLADVVQRHRRAVNTQGKLFKLSKITDEDCSFIEQVMTEFSKYEHSQPIESPIELPSPCELNHSISGIIEWHTQFDKR